MNPFDLTGKIALITGSSQGLGFGMARGLGQAGATVVLNGRKADKLERAAAAMTAEGLEAVGYAFDVTQEELVREVVDRIELEVGPIDILVNNAGMNLRGPIEDFDTAQWHQVMDLNLHAVFYVSKCVGKRMIARKRGKVIIIASLLSEAARPTITPYAASKGAVKMLTKGMAAEWAKHNIQVNAIGPGYFETELNAPLMQNEQFDKWVRERTPTGRWAKPEELAGTAVFFASSASDFVNGQILYVDGGWLAAL